MSFYNLIDECQLIERLEKGCEDVNSELLLRVVKQAMVHRIQTIVDLAQACRAYALPKPQWVDALLAGGYELEKYSVEVAIRLTEICLELIPDDPAIWFSYAYFGSGHADHQIAIDAAYAFKNKSTTPYWQVRADYAVVRELIRAGYAHRAAAMVDELKASLSCHLQEDMQNNEANGRNFNSLIAIPGILQYLQDCPEDTRSLQNQIAAKVQSAIDAQNQPLPSHLEHKQQPTKKLKIGYIGHTLRTHSVGWLCRWLLQHHDHEQFHITSYCVGQQTEELFTKTWFIKPSDACFALPNDIEVVTQKIREDEIDILVDLDSMTFPSTCIIMAARSAPVQVTWLGFDACGLPAIDYFIADSLVLPQEAEAYYQEKIWRLPQTYIAVDGFEVGVPDISRDSLNIPADAVVYYSSQTGSKRNPDNIYQQMQILKAVPNSFLLVKGSGDPSVIQKMFSEIAEDVGISLERIRFLKRAPDEFVHRANMRIADIVLDTYPYTGATTTLEALWMGMPVVTRVGQQFAARNSYAFMTNAGISDGIAHSEQEYVEWGTRFGLERDLRHKVMWQLQQSRKTSPLWDAQGFTRQMEKAYQQMWQAYCRS
jgi:predicted O-linked N-acetylglucosamine transferase (SPINDLY family)